MDRPYYKSGRFFFFLILSYLFFFIIKVIALCFFFLLLSSFLNFLFLIIYVIMQKLLPLITFSRAMICEFLLFLQWGSDFARTGFNSFSYTLVNFAFCFSCSYEQINQSKCLNQFWYRANICSTVYLLFNLMLSENY